ncbi:4-hydroxythreonine-4-phosphate dehydrogenase PdxA [Leptothrix discophora]|uniref:4-hydroxythreonine-4-phosphate dehydrogenase n=1 Tax=Leptothrix discophora TaxID=89 RepID=A0ABT9G501_LEPDI|nr:4-hydroxythreonine-4-phosphate dehydrogenase PdxA [Leptothrix discophora]MDP4301559.1 4-hydroxythreonine-4-phosphate dehydrogenase PdxA [Leptothrix discophora]
MPSAAALRTDLPLLVSMGDPCGIGPETLVAAAMRGELDDAVVVGDPAVLQRAAGFVRRAPRAAGRDTPDDGPRLPIAVVGAVADARDLPPGVLAVWPLRDGPAVLAALPIGQVHADAGRAAAQAVRQAARAVQAGQGAALVTAPLHKEALAAAGEHHPGHTELLAELAGAPGAPADVRMMLANDQLKTVLVTVHCALREAIDRVTFDAVRDTLRIAHRSAAAWGQPRPRIAVAGLNPHAGEGGLFGREEIETIAPAIAAARAEGIDASGPHAPDTVFMRARQGEFDLVLAMYHDQGLIPVKYLGLDEGVNVTLGLPFVRTSPDHGTAFDIAGRGVADPASLIAALRMARRLIAGR